MVNDLPLDRGGGTERYISRLVEGLRAAGDIVDVFAGEVDHRGIGKARDFWDPKARRELERRAASFAPDLVHHHHVIRELSVSVLGVPDGVPCAVTVHDHRLVGGTDQPHASWFDRAKAVKGIFDRAVVRHSVDVLMAVSEQIGSRLRALGFPRVEVVPVFARDQGPAPCGADAARDVVFVGRLAADKGPTVLVEAFARIAERHPDARLVIVGDGPERERVARLASELSLRPPGSASAGGGRLELTGWLDEAGVTAALARARVVAVPSRPALRAEGMPLTAIEAAMLGRPLVVSDDPGLVEMLSGSDAGIVTPAGSVDALADALDRLLGDDILSRRMSSAARALAVARFSPPVGVGAVRRVYDALLTRAP
jgi:glycosyltransferase involved in cell wall biosynthesis